MAKRLLIPPTRRTEPQVGWPTNPAAVLATVWAAIFAAVHLYWTLGGGIGGPTPLLTEVIAIPGGVGAALLAWRLTGGYQRWIFIGASAAASVMVWHALLNYLFLAVRVALDQPLSTNDRFCAFSYEPFWLLGGVVWLAAVVRYRCLLGLVVSSELPLALRNEVAGDVGIDLRPQRQLHLRRSERDLYRVLGQPAELDFVEIQ